MNIWFVSIFENTPLDDNQNTRYNSLVNEAVSRGHNVTFWASTFKHNVKKQRYIQTHTEEISDNLKVIYVASRAYKKNISFGRIRSHFKLAKEMVGQFEKEVVKPDLIVNAFPPISLAYKVSEWAKQNNIPYIMDVIDPWPDVFRSHTKMIPGFIADAAFYSLEKRVRKTVENSDAVIGISNQYVDWAKNFAPGTKISQCYYPAVQFDKMQDELKNASESIVGKIDEDLLEVIYAGSLGYSYDIETILKAADIIETNYGTNIHFTIAGDGPQKDKVEEYQENHENLIYVGRVPKEKLMEHYYKSDLGMTQHIAGATQSVTYKLFDLLACGLPILNSLESEMKEIILDHNVGLHNAPGDAENLVENILFCFNNRDILELMKQNAVDLTKELGDSERVYAEALNFFETFQIEVNDAG